MTVYHPKHWLREMPKGARFYVSKADLRIEHPDLKDAEIVSAVFNGPVEQLVLKPEAPRKTLKLSGDMVVLDVPNAGQPNITSEEETTGGDGGGSEPPVDQAQPATAEPTPAPVPDAKPAKQKKQQKKTNA